MLSTKKVLELCTPLVSSFNELYNKMSDGLVELLNSNGGFINILQMSDDLPQCEVLNLDNANEIIDYVWAIKLCDGKIYILLESNVLFDCDEEYTDEYLMNSDEWIELYDFYYPFGVLEAIYRFLDDYAHNRPC